MAFTKINAAGIGTTETVTVDGLTVINDGSFGGNLSVSGVLTYEDVTNVDSVGLITARNGIVVGSGITLSKDGDGFFTGVVTATSYAGSGANLTGIDTDLVSDTSPQLGGNLDVNTKNIVFGDSGGATDDRLTFGAGTDLEIYHDSNHSRIHNNTGILLIEGDGNIEINAGASTANMAKFINGGAVEIYHNNAKKIETTTDGIQVTGAIFASGKLDIPDNANLMLGDGDDLQIYHSGSLNLIDVYTSDLQIRNGSSEKMAVFSRNGTVELYYDNARKLSTAAGGLEFFGRSVDCQVNFNNADNSTRYGGVYGYTESGVDIMAFLKSNGSYSLVVNDNGEVRTYGHVRPNADNSYDLGTSTHRWRNLYTTDLQLSNEGKSNDVDGTWGNYTIQEGESDLFLINNRSGKKYKFNLTEVS